MPRNRPRPIASGPSRAATGCGSSQGRFTYCHLSSYVAGNGEPVNAGELVAYSGNTGHSSGPHLHVQGMDGSQNVCPQPYLVAVYNGQTPPTVSELPTTGCTS